MDIQSCDSSTVHIVCFVIAVYDRILSTLLPSIQRSVVFLLLFVYLFVVCSHYSILDEVVFSVCSIALHFLRVLVLQNFMLRLALRLICRPLVSFDY